MYINVNVNVDEILDELDDSDIIKECESRRLNLPLASLEVYDWIQNHYKRADFPLSIVRLIENATGKTFIR